jgi:hypothetical protein
MVMKSKDSTEPWVGYNCTCELVYFITWHLIRRFQCWHVQYCSHSALSEIKKYTLINVCLSLYVKWTYIICRTGQNNILWKDNLEFKMKHHC